MNSIYAITPVNLSLEEIISKTSNLLELGIKTYQYRDKNDDLNIIFWRLRFKCIINVYVS